MPLTITLHRTDDNRAEVYVAGEHIASFDPAALRLDHPFVRPHQQASDPVAYGQRLLAALGGDNLKRMLTELPSAPQLESMIALHTTDAELAAIPWEFLHNGNEFLITRYLLVREVEVPNALLPAPPLSDQPWRLVVVASSPLLKEVYDEQGRQCDWQLMAPLPVEHELDLLRDDFQKQRLHLRWQQIAPTRSALIDELATIEPLLLHFAGHGAVVNGTPVLYFDDGAGKLDPQTASDLANHLRGMVMLAFLNACRTADSIEPGANLALTLVQHGIPVVLGNQYLVFDEAAAPVARTFYRFLATGLHPAQALYRARLQLQSHRRNEPLAWAVPVLYLARGYQWPKPPVGNQHQPPPPIEPPRPAISALNAPDYATGAFVGRQQELYELARLFVHDQKRIVTIRGTGGIGKTALAAALAHRLRFFFDDGIVALSLVLPGEHATLAAATVRRQLAMALGIDVKDEKSWSADEQEQEDLLITTIRSRRRMLVIWDNYETVLWRLGLETVTDDVAPFAPEQRDEAVAIQRLVRKLADSGAWMLFTTRQSPVGLPGEVCFPPIEAGQQLAGLNPEASVELMRRWISKRTPSETFLRQLADALDHHPLAMVLTIRRWDRGQDAENAFLEQLDQALAEARDPAAPVYQQTSVEISVRLSLAALPPKLQEALRCLTIIANPKITPLHAAVVWEMTEGSQWLVEPAHRQLETLQQTSLLLGHGYDQEHNRALTYAIQPVIATVLRRDAQAHDLSAARIRYGRWAAALVDQAYDSQHGINASAELAQQMQSLLPDIAEALAALPIAEQGWALWRATWVLNRLGDPATAWRLIEQANQFAQEHNDEALLSRVYHQQADLLVTRGDLDGALALYQQSLALWESLGDVQGKSATLHQMANVLVTRGDLDGALALYQQSLALDESLGDVQGKSATLHTMANVLVTRGDLDGALALYQQSLAIKERLGDVQGKSATLVMMAQVQFMRGEHDQALCNARESLRLLQAMGAQPDAAKVAEIIQRMEAIRRQAAAPTQGVEGSAQIEEATTALAALLEQLPPTQRAEAQVLLQVAPLLIGAAALLGRADADAERKALAVVLEQAADLAAAGEAAGSPWLAAAATLRTLAGWLAGAPVDLDALAEPYRGLMRQVME